MTIPPAGRARATACYARYTDAMDTISHRELRNNSGSVLQAVSAGESYTVTNNNVPVAKIVPVDAAAPELRRVRPARKHGGFSALTRYEIHETVAEALDELRGDR